MSLTDEIIVVLAKKPIPKLPSIDATKLPKFIEIFFGSASIGVLELKHPELANERAEFKADIQNGSNEIFLYDGLRAHLSGHSTRSRPVGVVFSMQEHAVTVTVSNLPVIVLQSMGSNLKHSAFNKNATGHLETSVEDFLLNGRMIASWHSDTQSESQAMLYIELIYRKSGELYSASLKLEKDKNTDLNNSLNLPKFSLTHGPFSDTYIKNIEASRGAGELLQEWIYVEGGERPSWRGPVEKVSYVFPSQSISEEFDKGIAYRKQKKHEEGDEPVKSRLNSNAYLTVTSRADQRGNVQIPGNTLDRLAFGTLSRLKIEPIEPLIFEYDENRASNNSHVVITVHNLQLPQAVRLLPNPNTFGVDKETLPSYFLESYLPHALAEWGAGVNWYEAANPNTRNYHLKAVMRNRLSHLVQQAAFQHCVAEFPIRNYGDLAAPLNLTDGLMATLVPPADTNKAKALLPLNTKERLAYYDTPQESNIKDFIALPEISQNPKKDPDDAFAMGLLQTIDFDSELKAVLQNTKATKCVIRGLALSALGCTGPFMASFDNGRTIFEILIKDGQIEKVTKRRIGRISGALNRAEHNVVYARAAAPSTQFRFEQGEVVGDPKSLENCQLGWPRLRKVAEFVKITQQRRIFTEEPDAFRNSARVVHSSYFPVQEIKVNSAWGRPLKEGYEIPLWSKTDRSGYYPKPAIAITCFSDNDNLADAWRMHPDACYFYTSTSPLLGDDTDAWPAVLDVDASTTISTSLISSYCNFGEPEKQVKYLVMPSIDVTNLSNPRFQIAVQASAPCNLCQNGENKTEVLLATPTFITLDRATRETVSDASMAVLENKTTFKERFESIAGYVPNPLKKAAEIRSVEALLNRLPLELERVLAGFSLGELTDGDICNRVKKELKEKINQVCDEAISRLSTQIGSVINNDGLIQLLLLPITELEKRADEHLDDLNKKFETGQVEIIGAIDALSILVNNKVYAELGNAFAKIVQLPLFVNIRKSLLSLEHLSGEWVGIHAFSDAVLELERALTSTQNQLTTFLAKLTIAITNLADPVLAQVKLIQEQARNASVEVESLNASLLSAKKKFSEQKINIPKGFESIAEPIVIAFNACEKTGKAVTDELAKVESLDENATLAEVKIMLESIKAEIATVQDNANITFAKIKTVTDNIKEFASNLKNIVSDMGRDVYIWLRDMLNDLWTITNEPLPVANDKLFDLVQLAYALENTTKNIFENKLESKIKPTLVKLNTGLETVKNCVALQRSDNKKSFYNFHNDALVWLKPLVNQTISVADDAQKTVGNGINKLRNFATGEVDGVVCAAFNGDMTKIRNMAVKLESEAAESLSGFVAKLLDEDTKRRFLQIDQDVKDLVEKGNIELQKYIPVADLGLKVHNLCTKPWPLPNLNVTTLNSEYSLNQYTTELLSSPTVVLLGEVAAGLKSCGLALPSNRVFNGQLTSLEKEAKAFVNFFAALPEIFLEWMKALPRDSIRKEDVIDPVTKQNWVKISIDYIFPGDPKRLFDSGPMALEVGQAAISLQTYLDERGTAKLHAKITGDWMLAFQGQALATFKSVKLEYASDGGFSFDLDPAKIEPHPSLKFITDLMKQVQDALPPEVKLERDLKGQVVGASALLVQKFPGFSIVGVDIGPFDIGSGFALVLKNSQMILNSNFSLGTRNSPVFLQYGVYGGGGWIEVSAGYNDGQVTYDALVGVSVGSTKTLDLAAVARGSYTIVIYFSAAFSENMTLIESGISVIGSAKLLGYLNANLSLLLRVTYDGHDMKGRGSLDVEIEICWCYSVRIRSEVDHKIN